jgi:Fe-S-cluster containining protein
LRKEAETISETACETIKAFAHQTRGHEPYVYEMRKNGNGKCVFLEGDACSIYGSRPLICRYYPFELKSQESGKCEFSLTTECQGLASGDVLRESYFKALFRIARERLG